MPLQFPSNPSTGQTYQSGSLATYVYNGEAWDVQTVGALSVTSASFATSASRAVSSATATSASFSTTASFVVTAQTASFLAGNAWIQTTTTIGATTTAPTKGTVATDFIRYRQVAPKEYEVDMMYYQTGGGSSGNGDYLFTLPGGLQFSNAAYWFNTNTGGVDSTPVKNGAIIRGSYGAVTNTFNNGGVFAVVYDATRFKLVYGHSISAGASPNEVVRSGYAQMGSANVIYVMRFTFTAA
jgi:hypothetical protein